MFAYCNNNPVNLHDPSGEFAILLWPLAVIVAKAAIATLAVVGAAYLGSLAGKKLSNYVNKSKSSQNIDTVSTNSINIGKNNVNEKSISKPKNGLRRPYVRKKVRKAVEDNAPRTSDGRPIDPNTGIPIDGKPDLGHKAGNEFWREKAKAENEGLTQKQFNDRMNNPDLYQLENPSSNRSHRFEQK